MSEKNKETLLFSIEKSVNILKESILSSDDDKEIYHAFGTAIH